MITISVADFVLPCAVCELFLGGAKAPAPHRKRLTSRLLQFDKFLRSRGLPLDANNNYNRQVSTRSLGSAWAAKEGANEATKIAYLFGASLGARVEYFNTQQYNNGTHAPAAPVRQISLGFISF